MAGRLSDYADRVKAFIRANAKALAIGAAAGLVLGLIF